MDPIELIAEACEKVSELTTISKSNWPTLIVLIGNSFAPARFSSDCEPFADKLVSQNSRDVRNAKHRGKCFIF